MDMFKRAPLASNLAAKILTVSPVSASSSGLFLAAPRRTGKSTFLREDLRPALEERGALVVYADLWEDRCADPGEVIVGAVRAELSKHAGVVRRLARSAGMEKFAVGGLSFSLDRVGLGDGISLSEALAALSDEAGKPIVLVIDEAQHAITSARGNNALFALKAARDELNSSRHHGLRIVATGSNRDKLAILRSSRDQAFFGAPLFDFPSLGMDYVQWFCERMDLEPMLDPAEVFALFKRATFRPEFLGAAADTLRFGAELPPGTVDTRFADAVEAQVANSNAEQLRVVHSLTPFQAAVLRVMAAQGNRYSPFAPSTVTAYGIVLKEIDRAANGQINVSEIEQALLTLQDQALVWRAARGIYALEETGLADLMRQAGMLDAVPAAADHPTLQRRLIPGPGAEATMRGR